MEMNQLLWKIHEGTRKASKIDLAIIYLQLRWDGIITVVVTEWPRSSVCKYSTFNATRPYTWHQVLRKLSIREGVTDLRTDGRTDPLIEVRGRI